LDTDIGSFGSQISTPNLDALAKDGKILMDYHTISVCSRARVSLITGVDHHIGGIAIKRSQKEIPYLNMTVRTFSLNRVHGILPFHPTFAGKG
jgi:hypothetical protein